MVSIPRGIISTPFSSRDIRVLKKTNLNIKNIIGDVQISRRQTSLRNLRDKIESKQLKSRSRGAIE